MNTDESKLTQQERAEISKRKVEVDTQKKMKNEETLDSLKKELGISDKGNAK